MTEQEKREKAIEEMESDICNGCKYYKGKDLCCICDVISYAKTLVDLHYRKEEEVQKETLQKLFKLINENLFDWGEWWESGLFFAIQPDTIKKIIKEEFNVEVEGNG